LKNNTNMLFEKLNAKRQGQIIFRSFIVEKMNTPLDETIHIMIVCVVHIHGYRNKVVPLMKPFILANFNNGIKFHNYTCRLINDICNHHFSCWDNNHHIDNKDLVLLSHVELCS
jgi:hypothetical protein